MKKCSKEVMEQVCICKYIVWHVWRESEKMKEIVIDAQMEELEDAIAYARKLHKKFGITFHVEESNND